jgi:hypothetical protein
LGPHTQANETEARFDDNGRSNPQGSHDQDLSKNIRKNMNRHNLGVTLAHGTGSLDKLLSFD